MKKEKKNKQTTPSPDTFKWVSDFFLKLTNPEHKRIAKRLNDRADYMKPAYKEITEKIEQLSRPPDKVKPIYADILWGIIHGAVSYDVSGAKEERERIKQLKELQNEIIKNTKMLIKLLDRHNDIQEKGRVVSDAFTNIFHLIEETGKEEPLYEWHIAPILERINSFDERYYPSLQQFLGALIKEFQENKPAPLTRDDDAVLRSQKTSNVDFIRFFISRLKAIKGTYKLGEFSLTAECLAIIAECALDLDKDSKFSASHVRKAKKLLEEEDY